MSDRFGIQFSMVLVVLLYAKAMFGYIRQCVGLFRCVCVLVCAFISFRRLYLGSVSIFLFVLSLPLCVCVPVCVSVCVCLLCLCFGVRVMRVSA